MPYKILENIATINEDSFPYIFGQNVTVPLKNDSGLVRCNVYRPRNRITKWPVLLTYGPYGKDIRYQE
jgi:hypothetical protein